MDVLLKILVLEGLRRHQLSHVLLNHAMTKDVELEGYLVPKGAMVNFLVADIGCEYATQVCGTNLWSSSLRDSLLIVVLIAATVRRQIFLM